MRHSKLHATPLANGHGVADHLVGVLPLKVSRCFRTGVLRWIEADSLCPGAEPERMVVPAHRSINIRIGTQSEHYDRSQAFQTILISKDIRSGQKGTYFENIALAQELQLSPAASQLAPSQGDCRP